MHMYQISFYSLPILWSSPPEPMFYPWQPFKGTSLGSIKPSWFSFHFAWPHSPLPLTTGDTLEEKNLKKREREERAQWFGWGWMNPTNSVKLIGLYKEVESHHLTFKLSTLHTWLWLFLTAFAYSFAKISFSWAQVNIQWHLCKGQPKAAVISVPSCMEFWCYNLQNEQGKSAGRKERGRGPANVWSRIYTAFGNMQYCVSSK